MLMVCLFFVLNSDNKYFNVFEYSVFSNFWKNLRISSITIKLQFFLLLLLVYNSLEILFFSKNFLILVIIKWPGRQYILVNSLLIIRCNKFWVLVPAIQYQHQKQFQLVRLPLSSQSLILVLLLHLIRDLLLLFFIYLYLFQ